MSDRYMAVGTGLLRACRCVEVGCAGGSGDRFDLHSSDSSTKNDNNTNTNNTNTNTNGAESGAEWSWIRALQLNLL